MLEFFRKHQTYFFAVITFVIIISFSFFGTYSTITPNSMHQQIAFTAIDGTQVTRGELEEMSHFLSTDSEDKWLFGGVWGPNFLNDGVIKNDFLETGMAEILAMAYLPELEPDLQQRIAREKRYNLYVHPQAPFLSVESVWTYFVPNMKNNYDTLRNATDAASPDALKARIALYLDERKLPAPMLRQVLRYQEKQYPWISADPRLDQTDLFLFGYHTLDDWFGQRFLRIISEFIINSSKIAEEKGYKVTKEEALADLIYNAEISFQQNQRNPHLGVANSSEYLNEQLRHLGMDRTKAAKVWRQVLLFRRLFHDVGNAIVIDPLTHQVFNAYAKEQANGQIYRLPKEFQLSNFRALQKLQTYIEAVAPRDESKPLAIPTTFLAIDEIKRKSPELIQKKYVLEVAHVQKKGLQSKVGLKEMWNWEVSDENWEKLKNQFPELGTKNAQAREERMAILDNLDDVTRNRIDQYARAAIVDSHPEWLQEALNAAEVKRMSVGLRPKGQTTFVTGLKDPAQLIELLDQVSLDNPPTELPKSLEASLALATYTADNNNYYRIKVLERSPSEEIMTFDEASKEGILDQLLNTKLEKYYKDNRSKNTAEFRLDDGSWRPFAEVKDRVAELYFAKLTQAIRTDYEKASGKEGNETMTGDQTASLRFYAYMRDIKNQLKEGTSEAQNAIKEASADNSPQSEWKDQWKLERAPYTADRATEANDIDLTEILALAPGEWTKVQTPINGDVYFFQLQNKQMPENTAEVEKQLQEAHQIMSDDAQRTLMYRLVAELKDKNAISIDYLNRSAEMSTEEM